MKSLFACVVLGLALLPCAAGGGPPALKDFKNVVPAEVDVELVRPAKDPGTGFVIGGKNATELLRALKAINGRPIAELERDMRPGQLSTKGFLGKDEKLLDVLAADNEYVLGTLGLTHQELARHLLLVAAIAKKHLPAAAPAQEEGYTFRYHGRKLRVKRQSFRGRVVSPFEDDTSTNSEAVVENLDNGKTVKYSLLVPVMIERYGFYEGRGTPYRVEPRAIVEVFDFLKRAKAKD